MLCPPPFPSWTAPIPKAFSPSVQEGEAAIYYRGIFPKGVFGKTEFQCTYSLSCFLLLISYLMSKKQLLWL